MKKTGLFLFLFIHLQVFAQQDTLYKKYPDLPEFTAIKAPDSSLFNSQTIKKKGPVVILFFSPDCDHCKKEMKEILAYRQELKNIRFLMVSPLELKYLDVFYEDYGISSMPNITMLWDRTYYLGTFYKPRMFPAAYLYKNGIYLRSFIGNFSPTDLIEAFN